MFRNGRDGAPSGRLYRGLQQFPYNRAFGNLCYSPAHLSTYNRASSTVALIAVKPSMIGMPYVYPFCSPDARGLPPPLPKQFPRRHQVLQGTRLRELVAVHPALLPGFAVVVPDAVFAQHCQASPVAVQLFLGPGSVVGHWKILSSSLPLRQKAGRDIIINYFTCLIH